MKLRPLMAHILFCLLQIDELFMSALPRLLLGDNQNKSFTNFDQSFQNVSVSAMVIRIDRQACNYYSAELPIVGNACVTERANAALNVSPWRCIIHIPRSICRPR